jgi:hypothetical protein
MKRASPSSASFPRIAQAPRGFTQPHGQIDYGLQTLRVGGRQTTAM